MPKQTVEATQIRNEVGAGSRSALEGPATQGVCAARGLADDGCEPLVTLGPGGDYVRMLVAREARESVDSEAGIELVEVSVGRAAALDAEELARRAAAMHAERLRVQWAEHSQRHGELSAAHHILERQSGAAAASISLIGTLLRGLVARAGAAGSASGSSAGSLAGRSGGALIAGQGGQAMPTNRSSRRRAASQARQPTLFAR